MTIKVDNPSSRLVAVEDAVTSLGYRIIRVGEEDAKSADGDEIPDLAHITPSYKRALWIVILLNGGYGLIEIVGSFLAKSQALQADALDFVGDGMISFLGLIAIVVWRPCIPRMSRYQPIAHWCWRRWERLSRSARPLIHSPG